MNLGQLIKLLETYPPNHVVQVGIGKPHPYRGDYECLAFAKMELRTVAAMLDEAKKCLKGSLEATKGGMFDYTLASDVFIVPNVDEMGDALTAVVMDQLLDSPGTSSNEDVVLVENKPTQLIKPINTESLDYFETQKNLIAQLLLYVDKYKTPRNIDQLLTYTDQQIEYALMKLYKEGKVKIKEE